MSQIIETGKNYKGWAILKLSRKDSKGKVWLCQCKCGVVKEKYTTDLTRSKTGVCKSCSNAITNKNLSARNLLPNSWGIWNQFYASYKSKSRKRGFDFELQPVDFRSLCESCCIYCGVEPRQTYRRDNRYLTYNGIDRKDNTVGYVLENCVPCCKTCNYAKRAMTIVAWEAWVKRFTLFNTGN